MLMFFLFLTVFQNTFLSSLYKKASINTAKDSFDSFISNFKINYVSILESNYPSENFTTRTGMPIIILNSNFEVVNKDFFSNLSYFTIILESGEKRNLIIHQPEYQYFSSYYLITGSKVYYKGIKFGESNYIEPFMFTIGENQFYNDVFLRKWKNLSKAFASKETNIGILSSSYLKNSTETSLYKKSEFLFEKVLKKLIETEEFNEETNVIYASYFQDTTTAIDYAILEKTIYINDEKYYFFTIQMLDNLSIAFRLINPYYIFIYIGFLIILAVASFFYSRWLSKPLLDLNKVAKQIANLDFNARALVNTGDELEELGNSLNSVSESLEKTITDLEESNKKLSIEAIRRFEDEKRLRNILANLSHEFKTPLSIIIGAKNIIEEKIYEKNPKYYFDSITCEVNRLNRMINEAMQLTKLESGDFIIKEDIFNIGEMIKKLCKSIEEIAQEREVLISKKLENVTVKGDTYKIEQVILNLLYNAIKYSPLKTAISVNITIVSSNTCLIEIINDGEISNEDLEKIWIRYYRVASNKDFYGTGLGLNISKNILELHKSHFGVTSRNGKITFYFTLQIA